MARILAGLLKKMGKLAALPAALLLTASAAQAQHACRDCGSAHCPPAFKHVAEKHPRVQVRRGCAKPVCDPCSLPNWGYYATCWSRWPHADDQAHCRPTAGMVLVSDAAPALTPAPAVSPPTAPMALPQAAPPMPPMPQRTPPPGAQPLRPGL
jgi:hypothetical protein